MYSIKEIAAKFGLRASTIRYYEEIGLLENVVHEGGYKRVYDETHIDRLSAIECFKKARLSLEEIKQFFEYEKDIHSNSGNILEMMKAKELKTKEEINRLKAGLEHVQMKIKYYSAVDEAIKEGREIPAWGDIIK
ncbi:MAG: MerR family transcriptional regulator [Coprococcus sp.]|nr:MerR family transcriptional regulator [Coprococcus sp.]